MKENSARYTLYVRPIHVYHRSVYAIEAMEIVRPAYDVSAIGDAIFDEYPYLQPARGCLPLAGAEIDLLVGYDYAYLTTSVRSISAPNSTGHHQPSASFTRLGWTLFGGMIPQPKSCTGNQSAVQHLQRISDDTKATFYCDVPGVNATTDCVCTGTDMDDAKCLKRARTTEIDDVHQYVCHSGAIPAQRTRSKCTLVRRNVSLVHIYMTTTTAVHVIQDTGAFEPESTHRADDYRTTKISQPPTAEWDDPTHFTLFDKRLAQATSPNAPIDNEQLHKCGCESPTHTSEKDVDATIDADDRYCHAATRVVTRRNNWWNRGQVCLGRFSDSPNVDSLNFCLEQKPVLSHQAGVHATLTIWSVVCIQKEPVHASVSRCRRRCLAHRQCLARRCPLSYPLLSRRRYFDHRRRRRLARRRSRRDRRAAVVSHAAAVVSIAAAVVSIAAAVVSIAIAAAVVSLAAAVVSIAAAVVSLAAAVVSIAAAVVSLAAAVVSIAAAVVSIAAAVVSLAAAVISIAVVSLAVAVVSIAVAAVSLAAAVVSIAAAVVSIAIATAVVSLAAAVANAKCYERPVHKMCLIATHDELQHCFGRSD